MKSENKKTKPESALKKKIKELKKTTKGKAILKLIKWSIFFIIIFIFLGVSALMPKNNSPVKSNNKTEEKESINNAETNKEDNWNLETLSLETINKYQEDLNNIYTYNYEITINNEKYIYSGTKTKIDNKGFKESRNGIIKYYIDNTGTYEETTTDKILINNLYEGLDENYLNPLYILNVIKALEITRDKECDCIEPVYKANDNKNIYRLNTSNKELISITITALDFSYNYSLTFDNIKK